eukprot:4302832-Prymnesium_polylepis.1
MNENAVGFGCRLLVAFGCANHKTCHALEGCGPTHAAKSYVVHATRLTLVHSHINSQCLHGGLEDRSHAPGQDYWA